MRLGHLDLTLVHDGEFRLDGGAMFGVVPRPLWSKPKPPDERNRIRMGTNSLLVRRGRDLVLIDTGIGDKHDAQFADVYGFGQAPPRLPDRIRAAGFELGDVTHVLLTHLHFDHCGWNTRRDAGGNPVPTFPNARYWIARGELEHARQPNERDRVSYFPENWEPLLAAGRVELFDDRTTVVEGVTAVKAPGHNADMCVVELDGGGEARGVFLADLVPTSAHVPVPWIMSYDLYPMQTLASKKAWLPRIVAGNWLCFFQHDPDVPAGHVVEEKPGRYKAVPLAELAALASAAL